VCPSALATTTTEKGVEKRERGKRKRKRGESEYLLSEDFRHLRGGKEIPKDETRVALSLRLCPINIHERSLQQGNKIQKCFQ